MAIKLLATILLAAIVMNITVSVFIVKRDDLENTQKFLQIILVWLIPFLAAVGFWLLNRSHDIKVQKSKSFGGGAIERANINYGAGNEP